MVIFRSTVQKPERWNLKKGRQASLFYEEIDTALLHGNRFGTIWHDNCQTQYLPHLHAAAIIINLFGRKTV